MLYLKLYEMFNREDFYQEIDVDEYFEVTREFENLEKISDKEYYFFEDIVNKNYISVLFDNTCIHIGFGENNYSDKIYFFRKVKDEWWYVSRQIYNADSSIKFTYYKCDQWGGLMTFLKDKKII